MTLISIASKRPEKLAALAIFTALFLAPGAHANTTLKADVSYGPDLRHRVDLCFARPVDKPSRAVLLIHGGGWNGGDKADFRETCRYFAENGFTAAAIDYRFADGSQRGAWPAQLIDAQLAVRWLRAHAAELNIHPQHICAYGDSAGAHIAIWLAVKSSTQVGDYSAELGGFSSAISCAVDNFGPTNFTVPSPFQKTLSRLFPESELAGQQKLATQISPLFAVTSSAAPIFITHGYSDTAVAISQSTALAEALHEAHVRTELIAFEGGHEFSDVTPQARQSILALAFEFIARAPPR